MKWKRSEVLKEFHFWNLCFESLAELAKRFNIHLKTELINKNIYRHIVSTAVLVVVYKNFVFNICLVISK